MFHGLNHSLDEEFVANIANAKLEQWLKNAVKVYGYYEENKKCEAFGSRMEHHNPTHTALLINIKSIEKPKIIDREQADQMSAKICGLNLEQVAQIKDFYERITGNKADKL